jgi:hypothetical protein
MCERALKEDLKHIKNIAGRQLKNDMPAMIKKFFNSHKLNMVKKRKFTDLPDTSTNTEFDNTMLIDEEWYNLIK